MPARIPETMTAIGFDAPGGAEVLRPETLPVPIPGPGEVLIQVAFAGVNRPDVCSARATIPRRLAPRRSPGWRSRARS